MQNKLEKIENEKKVEKPTETENKLNQNHFLSFSFETSGRTMFSFSNQNKIATKLTCNEQYNGLFGNKLIEPKGITSFSIKIQKNNPTYVGIALDSESASDIVHPLGVV